MPAGGELDAAGDLRFAVFCAIIWASCEFGNAKIFSLHLLA